MGNRPCLLRLWLNGIRGNTLATLWWELQHASSLLQMLQRSGDRPLRCWTHGRPGSRSLKFRKVRAVLRVRPAITRVRRAFSGPQRRDL